MARRTDLERWGKRVKPKRVTKEQLKQDGHVWDGYRSLACAVILRALRDALSGAERNASEDDGSYRRRMRDRLDAQKFLGFVNERLVFWSDVAGLDATSLVEGFRRLQKSPGGRQKVFDWMHAYDRGKYGRHGDSRQALREAAS